MTTSVIRILPNGGYAGWDRLCLGWDASPPVNIGDAGGPAHDYMFNLTDTAVAGAVSKITIAYRIDCSEAFGRHSVLMGRMNIGGSYYSTAAVIRAESDPTWYYVDVALNPKTGAAWTWKELDALMAGVNCQTLYGGWCNLRQYAVDVTYTPAAYVPPMAVRGNVACGSGSMIL